MLERLEDLYVEFSDVLLDEINGDGEDALFVDLFNGGDNPRIKFPSHYRKLAKNARLDKLADRIDQIVSKIEQHNIDITEDDELVIADTIVLFDPMQGWSVEY